LAKEVLEQGKPAQCFDISIYVVAFAGVTTGDHNPICAFAEGFQDKLGFDTAAAHDPDWPHVGSVFDSRSPGQIGSPV
jgi:hypothetical protein